MTRSVKCRLLALVSTLTLLLAITFQALDLRVSSSFQIAYEIVFNIAAVTAVITIGYIILSGEIRKIQGIVLLVAYVCLYSYVGRTSIFEYIHTHGARHWFVDNSQDLIQKAGTTLLSYETESRHFPNSKNWCDLVLEKGKKIPYWEFKWGFGKRENSCSFAFNDNLSDLPIDGLDPNTVLIFEADGHWNFAGGVELFPGKRYRDSYFPQKERFAFVFVISGSLVKYRLYDAAIAVFNEKEGAFDKFRTKGDPCCPRLIWNRGN